MNVIYGLKRLGDRMFYRREVHGGYIYKTLLELPENYISLLEWRDFIIEGELEDYISTVEKVVIDDFFGYRPRIYALVTFFSLDHDISNLFRGEIRLNTSEWQPFKYIPVGDSPLIDYVYSYSLHHPSKVRPEIYYREFPVEYLEGVLYYNDSSSIDIEWRQIPIPEEGADYIIMPLNYFGGDIDIIRFYPSFHVEFEVLDRSSPLIKRYIEFLSEGQGRSAYIFPILINDGLAFKGGFIISSIGDVRYVDDVKFDLGDLVVSLIPLRTGKPILTFKRFRCRNYITSPKALYANIAFHRFTRDTSNLFIEYRYYGKFIWSSSSSKGFKRIVDI